MRPPHWGLTAVAQVQKPEVVVATAIAGAVLAVALALAQPARSDETAQGNAAAGKAPEGRLAHWAMDEIVGGKVADLSGHGHDAVVKAEGVLPQLAEGIIGKAMKFVRSERQWLEVPYSPQLDAPAQITVMAWVKVAERNKAYAVVCHKGDKSGPPPWPGWRLRVFWTRAVFQIGTPDGKEFTAASERWDVMPGKWAHIAGTYDGRAVRIYVNGVLRGQADAPGGIAPRKQAIIIGNYIGRKNAYPMDGLIDDVRIYGRALSADEIVAAASEGLPE